MIKKTKKVDKRENQIKKKLYAAVIMLLVSCIMTVTSTYAWFTLSTAPEIKGVSTTVGANGSLEIALATSETWDNPTLISSGVGTSGVFTAWGNMIDLSDSKYGLSNVKLYPAKLNEEAGLVKTSILQVPVYGVDGRVSELTNTITGTYVDTAFSSNSEKGVRVIGLNASMTPRQSAYRNAIDSILINKASAQNNIKSSWVNNGGHLSAVAINLALKDDAIVTAAQLTALDNLIMALKDSMLKVEDSMISAIDAFLASGASSLTDIQYNLVHNKLYEDTFTLLGTETNESALDCTNATACELNLNITEVDPIVLNEQMSSLLSSMMTLNSTINTAYGNLENVQTDADGNAKISDIKESVLAHLINITDENGVASVTIGGYAPSEVKEKPSLVLNDLTVSLNKGSGVYYDIAEFIGNYNANVTLPAGSYVNGLGDLEGTTVPLKTNYVGTTKLEAIKVIAEQAGEPEADNTSPDANVISDTFGYVIDFVVRTNADKSDLLLSTKAVDRVGNSSSEGGTNNSTTMGSGSNIIISSLAGDLSPETIKNLLDCMRVVFVTPTADGANTILAEARFDTTVNNQHDYDLKIWDAQNGLTDDGVIVKGLPQNQAYRISAIVYLDGETIDNADVSNSINSFVGTLNLQFASSAELVPMKYSDFQELENDEQVVDNRTAVEVPTISVGENNTYTVANVATTAGEMKYSIYTGELDTTKGTAVEAGHVYTVASGEKISFWVEVPTENTQYKSSEVVTYSYVDPTANG